MNNTNDLPCTDDDNSRVMTTLLIVGGWLSIATCTFGLLGNSFSIVALAQKRMRTLSTNAYLMALAVVNILWLIFFFLFYALRLTITIPYFISQHQKILYSSYNEIFYQLSPYTIPFMNILQLCITYYTVAVSVERYLYVLLGLNANNYCTMRNALCTIILLTIFSIMFVIPRGIFRVVTEINTQNQTYHIISSFAMIDQHKMLREVINIYIFIPVVYIIPFVVLILINILTVRRLVHYHDEHRRLLSTSIRQMAHLKTNVSYSRRHQHVTIMLVAVVLLFLLCHFPILISQIYEVQYLTTEDDDRRNYDHYFYCRVQPTFSIFANFMQTINSDGNLIIYLLCCQHFRETSKELFERLLTFTGLKSNETALEMTSRSSRRNTHFSDM